MRVLVVTVVHNPRDARIRYRQIPALLEAGHEVTYIAPFEHFGAPLPTEVPGLTGVSVPRAVGRSRLGALKAVRATVAAHAPAADIVLMHDPELVLAVAGLRRLPPVVWDVHEDTAAMMTLKPWLPRPLRPVAATAARLVERFAERRYHLLLADSSYRPLFQKNHPVVPNTTYVPTQVPPPGTERAIYVGHLTRARGTEEMIAIGRRLRGTVRIDLLGDADASVRPLVEKAHAEGSVVWHGFVPNDQALSMMDGALAGLSLLRNEPNYRNARTTKVVEYVARGVPPVSTPTIPAPDIANRHKAGLIVPFGDAEAAAEAILQLRSDTQLREELGKRAHQAALAEYAWPVHAREFVAHLERWAQ